MFLHSGASLHGHEYSNRPPQASVHQALNRRPPLLLSSPFSAPLSRSATPHQVREARDVSQFQPPGQLQSCLVQCQSPPGLRARRLTPPEPVVRFQEPVLEVDDTPKPSPAVAMVSEEEEAGSCSETSDIGVVPSSSTNGAKKRRRFPRKTNTFFFAHPAPRLAKKRLMKQIRPKLLLQLHQLSVDKRPTPVLDVFPSSTIAARGITGGRLAKRFPRLFGVMGEKSELGSHDIVLLKSEEYNSTDASSIGSGAEDDGDEGNLNHRDLVAVLSPLKGEDRTEIVLDDGSIWAAEPLPNGSYEFTHTDPKGDTTTARWVRRSMSKSTGPISPAKEIMAEINNLAVSGANSRTGGAPNHSSSGSSASPVENYRYTFSIIDPLSRRHPIMATLTRCTLDILENYTTVSSSCGRYPPSRPFGHPSQGSAALHPDEDSDGDGEQEHPRLERRSCPVDAAMKKLISITAVWVTLRQGGIMQTPTEGIQSSIGLRATNSLHRNSLGLQNGSTFPTKGIQHPGNHRTRRKDEEDRGALSPVVSPAPITRALTPRLSPPRSQTAPRRRATSTGAAFMQRRMQISDASDSEIPSLRGECSKLRSRGKRVLSGEWSAAWKRHSQPDEAAVRAHGHHNNNRFSDSPNNHRSPTPGSIKRCSTPSVTATPSSILTTNSRPDSGQNHEQQLRLREQGEERDRLADRERKVQSAYNAIIGVAEASNGASIKANTTHDNSRINTADRASITAHAQPATPLGLPDGGVLLRSPTSPPADGLLHHLHQHERDGEEETDLENRRPGRRWRRLSHWIRRLGR